MPKTAKTKRMILPATDKGGVGKSFFCVQLVDWLKRRHPDRSWVAFDPDASNQTLKRFHPETQFLDVGKHSGLDPVFLALGEAEIAICDGVGAQQKSLFQKWVEEVSLVDLAEEAGIGITYYLSIEDSTDVIHSVRSIMEEVGDRVDWLLVRNLKQAREFTLWDRSTAYELFRKLQGREIVFEAVQPSLVTFYDHKNLPFSECDSQPEVNVLDMQRFRNLTDRIDEQFASVASILVPKGTGGRQAKKTAKTGG